MIGSVSKLNFIIKKLLRKTINLYKKLNKVKFRFDLPVKKKILLYDELHSWALKEIIKKKFNILKIRDEKEIYFWIFLKQIIFFDFKFKTYCKNYIKFISPKIVVTFIDTNIDFYELKDSFKNIHFISIQNGIRTPDWFKSKRMKTSKNLKCDHIFVFNKYIKNKYSNYINSKYHILGTFKNNIAKVNKTKNNNHFLLISEFEKSTKVKLNFKKKLLNFINLYRLKTNKKIHILLKSKDSFKQKEEISFYKNFFQSECIFLKSLKWKQSYEIIDRFENIIFMYSTLGYEAIARKKKVAIFSPDKIHGFKYYFGWPATYKKSYNFFSTKKLTYSEIKRVLNNISNCSQINWQNKYYSIIKDQMYLNKKNTKLKKVIFELLEDSNK